MSAPHLLVMNQVACVRGGRLLFERMDLVLSPGAAVLVTGPNGAGKSSLLRLAAGLLRPSSGAVEASAPLAFADEAAALDDRSTLGRALAFWAGIDGVDALAGMETMGLTHLAQVPVRLLSSGQRKRAALARVIASRAPLWLLDEPANGLDTDAQHLLAGAAADHCLRGGALLAASHQPLGLEPTATIALAAP